MRPCEPRAVLLPACCCSTFYRFLQLARVMADWSGLAHTLPTFGATPVGLRMGYLLFTQQIFRPIGDYMEFRGVSRVTRSDRLGITPIMDAGLTARTRTDRSRFLRSGRTYRVWRGRVRVRWAPAICPASVAEAGLMAGSYRMPDLSNVNCSVSAPPTSHTLRP